MNFQKRRVLVCRQLPAEQVQSGQSDHSSWHGQLGTIRSTYKFESSIAWLRYEPLIAGMSGRINCSAPRKIPGLWAFTSIVPVKFSLDQNNSSKSFACQNSQSSPNGFNFGVTINVVDQGVGGPGSL